MSIISVETIGCKCNFCNKQINIYSDNINDTQKDFYDELIKLYALMSRAYNDYDSLKGILFICPQCLYGVTNR